VALQQGIAVGQENPIVATHSQSFDEILKVASLNNHQVGIHWLVVGENTYDKLSEEQADLLDETIHGIRAENRECVEEETNKILDEYRADSSFTVVEEDDIDKDAFIEQAEEFFGTYYDGERLELYESIRGMVN
jgi:TRAP-type C4-dicarboxylate transport system substrate-binding protein